MKNFFKFFLSLIAGWSAGSAFLLSALWFKQIEAVSVQLKGISSFLAPLLPIISVKLHFFISVSVLLLVVIGTWILRPEKSDKTDGKLP